MKKKLAWKLILLGILCMAFAAGVSVGIDPYNVFHWRAVRDNGVEPNHNYIKTQYVINNPDRYNMFIFGNSRVGFMDAAKIMDGNCYNMYYSEGLPKEHYENLLAFLEAGVQVDRVYLGVDDVTCFADPALHDDQLIRRPFRANETKLAFLWDYMDPSVALQSLETSLSYKGTEDIGARLYSTGNYHLETLMTEENLLKEEWPGYFEWHGEGAIEDIRQIVTLCRQEGIELVVFVNPEHQARFDDAVKRGYLDFLRQLADVTDYYSFCGYNAVTTDMWYFHDISHYRMEAGDLILSVLQAEPIDPALQSEGFGQYVSKETVDAYIEGLQGQQGY